MGLEPTKTGFADQRLDRFGIATKTLLKTCTKPCATCTQLYTQNCTQIALVSPIYAVSSLPNLLKPRVTNGNGGFCRSFPCHLATAPLLQVADLSSGIAPGRHERPNPKSTIPAIVPSLRWTISTQIFTSSSFFRKTNQVHRLGAPKNPKSARRVPQAITCDAN